MDVDSSTDTPFAAAGTGAVGAAGGWAPFGTVPTATDTDTDTDTPFAATTIIAATPEVRGDGNGDGVFWESLKLEMAVGRVQDAIYQCLKHIHHRMD